MGRERRVAFLARDLVWGDESDGSLPFSYAARKVEASVRSASDLGDVETTMIDLRETDPDAYFEKIRAFRPTLVAASTYIWSIDLFCKVAEKVHAWDPSVRFVMGGPAARPSMMALAPYQPRAKYVHAVVKGEGEEVIRRLARDHLRDDWLETTPGLLARHPLGYRNTGELEPPVLDEYASPYALGTIPNAKHGFFETFRGCPISCAFCQWGDERADRIYSQAYLESHLAGFEETGVEIVHVLDAAFNLSSRAFRNLAAAEKNVQALKGRKVIGHVYPSYLKEHHLELLDHCGQAELDVGIQSFDKQVLKGLGRPFDPNRFESMLKVITGRYPIGIEIIMGLPGDTPENFRRTFERALEYPVKVRVFWCLALPDALLERAEKFNIDFDPVTFGVHSCDGWSHEDLVREWENVLAVAETMDTPMVGSNWVQFRTHTHRETNSGQVIGTRMQDQLRGVFERAGGYRLEGAERGREGLIMRLSGRSVPVVLQASIAKEGQRSFVEHDGIAYSYRGQLPRHEAPGLRSLIDRVHTDLGPICRAEAAQRPG